MKYMLNMGSKTKKPQKISSHIVVMERTIINTTQILMTWLFSGEQQMSDLLDIQNYLYYLAKMCYQLLKIIRRLR